MIFALLRRAGTVAVLAVLSVACAPTHAQFFGNESKIHADSIPKSELIQPEELNRILTSKEAEKPTLLQVGSLLMYRQAHIPGAVYAGVTSEAVGLTQLQGRVSPLAHDTFIVLYCGCCPWDRCPNVGPAFKLLHDFGFTRVKVLYLANNFGTDWVDKGFPVERRH